jgi:3-isopropylmalate/(R)-2-methylmalate dehydratase small subunit
MIIEGRVAWIFPDNFDADNIVGVANITSLDVEFLKSVTMKDYEEDFLQKIKPGDIMIAGKNFGYGHPHPQSMRALRALGITDFIGESYFHAFYRGELASGSRIFTCPDITKKVDRWDVLRFDTETGVIENKTKGTTIQADPVGKYPAYLMEHGVLDFIKAVNAGEI